jgi:hypothetical protein
MRWVELGICSDCGDRIKLLVFDEDREEFLRDFKYCPHCGKPWHTAKEGRAK